MGAEQERVAGLRRLEDGLRQAGDRWGEDGPAGFSDIEQRLCLGLALWNGRDPKARPFGLTGPQGNHGEDVREYWWYLDATPSHSWNRWRYHYPRCAFPCQDLVEQNAARGRLQPEYELIDTDVISRHGTVQTVGGILRLYGPKAQP